MTVQAFAGHQPKSLDGRVMPGHDGEASFSEKLLTPKQE